MKEEATYSNLEELIKSTKGQDNYTVVYLVPEESGRKFLIDTVIQRVQLELSTDIAFRLIEGDSADLLKTQLKIKKLPILLILKNGLLESIYEGMIGSTQLKSIINNLTTIQKEDPLWA